MRAVQALERGPDSRSSLHPDAVGWGVELPGSTETGAVGSAASLRRAQEKITLANASAGDYFGQSVGIWDSPLSFGTQQDQCNAMMQCNSFVFPSCAVAL